MEISQNRTFPGIHLVAWVCILSAFILCYQDVLVWMYGRYMGADSNYSHGFLVPLVSAFLVWQKREQLSRETADSNQWGLAVMAFALLLHLAGTVFYVFSVSGFSIFFLVLGICLFVFGSAVTREILFPVMFLIFMFPLPMAFVEIISFPLKVIVAHAGTKLAALSGVPILREGFLITIPSGDMVVGNPCSGLRSLISFLALGAVFAYLGNISLPRKLILFFSVIPVAIVSNILRIPMLIFLEHFWAINAASPESWWHTASGSLVFMLALVLMYFMARLLHWR